MMEIICSRPANLKIRGTVPRKHRFGVLEQVITQPFGHSFPADQYVDRVVLPVEPALLPFIHQMLQEWRIADTFPVASRLHKISITLRI